MGLQFSANLNEMTEINFETAIKKAKTELKSWKYRTLSPIGKIAVLKSLILPKFVHLFSSIPASQSTIAEINTIFYSFLWGNKPDKIKREVICKDYLDGGLRMINLFNFEKAQKIKWLKYILQKEQHTYNLFHEEMRNLESITLFGGEYCAKFCKLLNPFWKAVFIYWAEFCASQQIKSNEDISNSALWFNKDLATNDIHLPNWSKKGINFVHDIIDTNGNVLPLETLSEKFSLKINFLHYFTVQGLVKKFIAKYKKGDQFDSIKPFVPFHLKNVVKSQQNKKLIYQSLCKSNDIKLSNDIKWNTELGLEIDKTMWKNLNKACFYTIKDNMYIWLQCRIIKRILGTNSFLKKAKISNNDLCRICHEQTETLAHLFFECNKVFDLWVNIKHWIEIKTKIQLNLNKNICILGYSLCDANFYPLNFVLITVRYYIFKCALTNRDLNIYQIQKIVKEKYFEQELLSKLNGEEEIFKRRWLIWKMAFSEI